MLNYLDDSNNVFPDNVYIMRAYEINLKKERGICTAQKTTVAQNFNEIMQINLLINSMKQNSHSL